MNHTQFLRTFATAGVALVAVSACTPKAGMNGLTDMQTVSLDSFVALAVAAKTEFQDNIAESTVALPTTGTGTFQGFGRVDISDTPADTTGTQLFGAAELTAAFSPTGANIAGTVDNFYSADAILFTDLQLALESGNPDQVKALIEVSEPALSGSLDVSAPNATGPLFTADISGEVDTGTTAFDFSGTANGEFYGNPATVIRVTGDSSGGLFVNEGPGTRNATLVIIGSQ
ncbi:MAG: hypothetical protein VX874_14440 [Pseudomonadota bacterium]|nr:hypothetical protein [Pseudomonadota bacterium]